MRAVVVHESLFGNTAAVAEAIASGLRGLYEVTVLRARDASPEMLSAADLVVVGAPTHGHGLPTMSSRSNAAQRQQLAPEVAAPGVRELLEVLSVSGGHLAAAFDTRLGWPLFLSGAASKGIAKRLRTAGFTLVAPPESFIVAGAQGPMRDGELQRAAEWAATLARTGATRAAVAA